MADGVTLNPMAGGKIVDTEEVTRNAETVELQRIKLVLGAVDVDGGDVSAANPLPVQGNVADQATDSGNSVKVGMYLFSSAPTPKVGWRMPVQSDYFGNTMVSLGALISLLIGGMESHTIGVAPFRRADAFEAVLESANVTSATAVVAAPSNTNQSIYITDVTISTDTIGWIKLQDNAGSPNTIVPKKYFNTNGHYTHTYAVPKRIIAGNALNVIAQNAGNVSVEVNGYIY